MAEMKNLTINGTQFTLPFAPAGYGLGETQAKFLTSADDLNSQNKSGWYHWGETAPANAPTLKYGPNYSFMRVDGANEANFVQTVWSKYGDARGLMVTRVVIGGTPDDWEWGNPPMVLGVEYRTTARHNGKPVYAVLVNCGALPANSSKTVNICTYATTPVRAEWSIVNTSNPLRYSDISHAGATTNFYSSASDGITAVVINATSNLSGFNAVIAYYYTKD